MMPCNSEHCNREALGLIMPCNSVVWPASPEGLCVPDYTYSIVSIGLTTVSTGKEVLVLLI